MCVSLFTLQNTSVPIMAFKIRVVCCYFSVNLISLTCNKRPERQRVITVSQFMLIKIAVSVVVVIVAFFVHNAVSYVRH